MVLALADTTGIQPYVFGSNRLRENVGASFLVAQSTRAWAFEALVGAVGGDVARTNLREGPNGLDIDPERSPLGATGGAADAEVLYAGGGNTAVLFGAKQAADHAERFERALSEKLLAYAPGLRLVVCIRGIGPSESLSRTLSDLRRDLARAKHLRPPSAPLLGLGVTKACGSTGGPAVEEPTDLPDPYPVSAETRAKLGARNAARDRLRSVLGGGPYEFPTEFDHLGRSAGDQSYIAVVHADGNGMGDRIHRLGQRLAQPSDNAAFVRQLRAFSHALNEGSTRALRDTLGLLHGAIVGGEIVHPVREGAVPSLQLREDGAGPAYLPFLPLVFGGDDLTFVSDGRIGLPLAAAYLRAFERHTADLPDGSGGTAPATASAGVAIVKAHYPFARAYALAEELTSSAKAFRRAVRDRRGPDGHDVWDGAAIDWHIAQSGLLGDLDLIRDREYRTDEGPLTLRPLLMDPPEGHALRSWAAVEGVARTFQGPSWGARRSKTKALRDTLREGPVAVGRFRSAFLGGAPLPELEAADRGELRQRGWALDADGDMRCGYFDALELADRHLPIERALTGASDDVPSDPLPAA